MIYNGKQHNKFHVMTPIRQMLLSDTVIHGLVQDKIFPVICPEDAMNGSFIVYSRDSYGLQKTHQGIYEQNCRVFISCVSSDYDTASSIAEAVFNRLQGSHNYSDNNTVINSINLEDSTEDFANDKFIVTMMFEIR